MDFKQNLHREIAIAAPLMIAVSFVTSNDEANETFILFVAAILAVLLIILLILALFYFIKPNKRLIRFSDGINFKPFNNSFLFGILFGLPIEFTGMFVENTVLFYIGLGIVCFTGLGYMVLIVTVSLLDRFLPKKYSQ